jgi:hypothetical protein
MWWTDGRTCPLAIRHNWHILWIFSRICLNMLKYSLMDGQKPYRIDMIDGQTCRLVRRLDNPVYITALIGIEWNKATLVGIYFFNMTHFLVFFFFPTNIWRFLFYYLPWLEMKNIPCSILSRTWRVHIFRVWVSLKTF